MMGEEPSVGVSGGITRFSVSSIAEIRVSLSSQKNDESSSDWSSYSLSPSMSSSSSLIDMKFRMFL